MSRLQLSALSALVISLALAIGFLGGRTFAPARTASTVPDVPAVPTDGGAQPSPLREAEWVPVASERGTLGADRSSIYLFRYSALVEVGEGSVPVQYSEVRDPWTGEVSVLVEGGTVVYASIVDRLSAEDVRLVAVDSEEASQLCASWSPASHSSPELCFSSVDADSYRPAFVVNIDEG